MESVYERTSSILALTFKDEAGALVVPTSGAYSIDDVDSGTIIRASTAFTPTGSTYNVIIATAENRILNALAEKELRRVTVIFLYSGGQCTGEYFYEVKNLFGISITP